MRTGNPHITYLFERKIFSNPYLHMNTMSAFSSVGKYPPRANRKKETKQLANKTKGWSYASWGVRLQAAFMTVLCAMARTQIARATNRIADHNIQQQHSFFSQISWSRLEMKPERNKFKVQALVGFKSIRVAIFYAGLPKPNATLLLYPELGTGYAEMTHINRADQLTTTSLHI